MRTHIVNPTITVIMDTVGRESIATAIRSFIAQDYPFARLLIVNRHPSPLKVSGIPDSHRMRIEVVNQEDTFTRPVYQHIWNLKNIRTDCWTILDDDDWIDANHLSQLVAHWNTCTERTDAPLQVCGRNYKVHYDDKVVDLAFRGWAVSLFETLTPAEVDWVYKLFPAETLISSDTWIAWNSFYDKREFEAVPTYHWERRGQNHISQHETNRGDTEADRFKIALNYWRIKLDARSKPLLPVVV